MINIKQHEDAGLIDYVKRFKQARDIFKSHVGGDILDIFVTHTKEYRDAADDVKKQAIKEAALD